MIDLALEMSRLPEPVTDKTPPHWEFWRWQLWHRAQEEPAKDFLRWPCIYHTMCQLHWPDLVERERQMMLGDDGQLPYDISATPGLGTHTIYPLEWNNIRQLFHLRKWEEITGKKISSLDCIVEIGGGYGAGALMARRMGFGGKYIIYDLPEFSLLQRWFLEFARVDADCVSSLYPGRACDLLFGIYSLSEMPIGTRNAILDAYPAESVFALYTGKWADMDNLDYFQRELPSLIAPVWCHHEEALHHNDRNNWYLITRGQNKSKSF